jgi:beta-mannanase
MTDEQAKDFEKLLLAEQRNFNRLMKALDDKLEALNRNLVTVYETLTEMKETTDELISDRS